MNDRSFGIRKYGGPLVACTLMASLAAAGCGVGAGGGEANPDASTTQRVSSALSSTPPDNFSDALKELIQVSDTVGKALNGPVAIFQAYDVLQKLMGDGFEAEVTADLAAIRQQLSDIEAEIAAGQEVVSDQIAVHDIAAAQAAAETARRYIRDYGGAPFDPNSNPSAANANSDSRTATIAFEDQAWYSKLAGQGSARAFEWRLGLPHLISAIGFRLEVLGAIQPDFVTSGAYSGELMEYYNTIGSLLAQADAALIVCYDQPGVVIPPGGDTNLPIRDCYNYQNGELLPVGTLAHPIPDAIVRAELMDHMGFAQIRAFRDHLYMLANNLPSNDSFCSNEWETCFSSGLKTVRFGVDGAAYYRTMNGTFSCTNDIFGDPLQGALKNCTVGDVISYGCANEGENCYFDGVKYVTFGAGGGSTSTLALSGIECANGTGAFGWPDPSPGWFKSCTYREPVWTKCATEGGTCTLSGTNFVRYGYGDQFTYWQQNGSFACNNTLGDPAVGYVKSCEVASAQ